jgi:hypothetical protein
VNKLSNWIYKVSRSIRARTMLYEEIRDFLERKQQAGIPHTEISLRNNMVVIMKRGGKNFFIEVSRNDDGKTVDVGLYAEGHMLDSMEVNSLERFIGIFVEGNNGFFARLEKFKALRNLEGLQTKLTLHVREMDSVQAEIQAMHRLEQVDANHRDIIAQSIRIINLSGEVCSPARMSIALSEGMNDEFNNNMKMLKDRLQLLKNEHEALKAQVSRASQWLEEATSLVPRIVL